MAEMQRLIDKINKEDLSPTDAKWNDFEQEVLGSYTRSLMGEKQENNLGEIFATILLSQFGQFLNPSDADELREGLLRIKNSNDSFEKDSLRSDLEKTANKYILLIHVFMFKIIGDNSKTPQVAGRAICVFDEMMAALNNHNIQEVNSLISTNVDLLEKISEEGIDIGAGIGIA